MRIARFWRIKPVALEQDKFIYTTQMVTALDDKGLQIACGSDSIYYLDGRWSRLHAEAQMREICLERGHHAFSIGEGRSFREALAAADVAKKVHIV